MSSSGHGGALASAPAESRVGTQQLQAHLHSKASSPDVVLPRSVPTAPTQPEAEDATSAFPSAAADACSSGGSSIDGSSIRGSISNLSCFGDSSDNGSPQSPFSAQVDALAAIQQRLEKRTMGAPKHRQPAAPAGAPATIAAKPHTKLLRLVRGAFVSPLRAAVFRFEQHLLLPCLLGDPFISVHVDRKVGVSAGTLLGRLSLFYWGEHPPTKQDQTLRGQVLLPQAYSDDGVAICWADTSYVTAIMGASDLVQWRLPSLRCMGSEQLSLFAGRSAFNSVTISMRLLRRQLDTQQLPLLYRHCAKPLADIILMQIQRPSRKSSGSSSFLSTSSSKMRQQLKAWAEALAAGVCTLDSHDQLAQQQLVRHHSTCLLGTGAACIMDSREGDMYERYATNFFCKLWRSVEACNLIALDFNGDFVLGEGTMERRWLYVLDARGASRQVEESQGWCAARRSYMDGYLVYKRAAPRCMQHACFLSSFLLLIASVGGIAVYDMRMAFFSYHATRAKASNLSDPSSHLGAACAAFAACDSACTSYTGDAQQQQQQGQQQGGRSASSSGSRLLRRQPRAAAPVEGEGRVGEGSPLVDSNAPSATKARDAPLGCLPALFLRCLQRSAAEHERRHAHLNSNNTSLIRKLVSGASLKAVAASPTAGDHAQRAAAPAPATAAAAAAGNQQGSNASQENDEETLHVMPDGEGDSGEGRAARLRSHQQIAAACEGDCHAFFLFDKTPLAFRVCDAFFRFCALLLQHYRQQRSNLCADETAVNESRKPPEPSTNKPMVSCADSLCDQWSAPAAGSKEYAVEAKRLYRHHTRVLCVDALRQDFCFLSLDSSGWLRAYSLFRSKALQSVRLDRGLFAAGWPYVVASDGNVVALTSDKGVYALFLDEASLGCSWVTGAEAFCSMPLDTSLQEESSARNSAPP
ncbi:hypothetical protein ACSSS7_000983 [Eimeria intestinalis]